MLLLSEEIRETVELEWKNYKDINLGQGCIELIISEITNLPFYNCYDLVQQSL